MQLRRHHLEDIVFFSLVSLPIIGISAMQPSIPQKVIVPLLIIVQMAIAFVCGAAYRQDLDEKTARAKQRLEKIYRI